MRRFSKKGITTAPAASDEESATGGGGTARIPGGKGLKKLEKLQGYKVTRLQGYKVDPETPEPELEKEPSRSLLFMTRLGEWNECLLSPRCNVSTLLTF
jgi:hypothetical protein